MITPRCNSLEKQLRIGRCYGEKLIRKEIVMARKIPREKVLNGKRKLNEK